MWWKCLIVSVLLLVLVSGCLVLIVDTRGHPDCTQEPTATGCRTRTLGG